jgi:uncharacterized protein YdhG (YjbR/CyaY superfamily)
MGVMATTVDEYIESFPPDVRTVLQQARRAIRRAVPGIGETISYGIASFTVGGRHLVYLAGWKHHLSVYPVPSGDDALDAAIAPFRAAKGTLKFPLNKPVPYDLIERVAARLLAQREEAAP